MKLNKFLLSVALISGTAGAYEVLPDIDFKKPIYAREKALLCPTKESFLLGSNARDRSWHYAPTAGIKPPRKMQSGEKIAPEDLGCKELPDGRPLVFVGDQFTFIETTDGFTNRRMIRN